MQPHIVSAQSGPTTIPISNSGADSTSAVKVIPLGSGQEVGRSCVIVEYAGKSVMFDCGLHPARSSYQSLPLFDEYDLSRVSAIFATHFHLDHCGSIPFMCTQTSFSPSAKIIMTHATYSFLPLVIGDLIKVNSPGTADIARPEWLHSTMQRVERISYHSTHTVDGIRFTALNAGHVLGAAMFLVEIAGIKILYTGDYSRLPDRHLMAAELPPVSPDVLIVESTYGILEHKSVEARERQFVETASEIVRNNGRCLVPIFAFGRAQELLLLLEEYWEEHQELQNVPIYFASSVAGNCIGQYKTFAATSMNDRVQKQLERHINPFDFRHVRFLSDIRSFEDKGPCVVLASSGMLVSGLSRQLFERWCGGRQNGLILAGYCVEGTIADDVRRGRKQIEVEDGRVLNVNMGHILEVSFSAHADVKQTTDFIHSLPSCRNVVLVHGNPHAMGNLQKRLEDTFRSRSLVVHTPKTGGSVSIRFERQRAATLLGGLASKVMQAQQQQNTMMLKVQEGGGGGAAAAQQEQGNNVIAVVEGLAVQAEDHQLAVVSPSEVSNFSDVQLCRDFQQAVVLPLATYRTAHEIAKLLNSYFAASAPLHYWDHNMDLTQQQQQQQQQKQQAEEKGEDNNNNNNNKGTKNKNDDDEKNDNGATEKSAAVIAGVVDVGEDANLAARIPLMANNDEQQLGGGADDTTAAAVSDASTNISVVRVGRDVRAIIHENPVEGNTTVTVRWRSHTKSDIVADVVVAGLLICDSGSSSINNNNDGGGQSPIGSPLGGGGGGLPMDKNSSSKTGGLSPAESDNIIFRYQCFHRMLRQHFGSVSVNLRDGVALIIATAQVDGRQVSWPVEVRDWVVPRVLHPRRAGSNNVRGRKGSSSDDDDDGDNLAEDKNGSSSSSALPPMPESLKRKIGFTLQRIYLAINPIPFDDPSGEAGSNGGAGEDLIDNGGWCGCGMVH